jgi:hypothetical protein
MPRCVRNFFLQIEVDGKKTPIRTGPRSKNGGFHCRLLIRTDGQVHNDDVTIEGRERNGLLYLTIWAGGENIFRRTTKR